MKKILSLLIMFLLCQYSRGGMFNAYDISVEGTNNLVIGRYAKLTLRMYNTYEVVSWECTLPLPDGVSLYCAYTSGIRYPEGYNAKLTTTINEDSSVTLVCKGEEGVNMTGGNLSGSGYNGGEIATVIVKVDSSVMPSHDWFYTTDVIIEDANGTIHHNEYSSYSDLYTIKYYSYNNNYTDQLLCIINGESSGLEETSASVTDNGNETINLTLKNVMINSNDGTSLPLGTIKVQNIPVTYGKDGLDYFSHNSSIEIENGDTPGIDSWVGPMLGSNPITLQGRMNKGKIYVTLSLDMQKTIGQVLSFQLGTDDFVPDFPVEYTLTYLVDGEIYKTYSIVWGTALTPEAAPTKEGHTFSGWSEIPETMPTKDTTITGSFTVNKYNLTYKVDGKTYKTEQVNYGTSLNGPTPVKKGMTFSGWEGLPETMPAHDVTATGTFSWSKETIDGVIYQVTDTLSNFASVVGNDNISGEAIILSSVEVGGDTYIVDKIKKGAFRSSNLISVTIPNSVTSIGNDAFSVCAKLTSVTIGDNVTTIGTSAFQSCFQLASLTIGNSVATIGQYAFTDCDQLVSVTIPNSVTTIGHSAFRECNRLTSVTIGSGVTSMSDGVFMDCYNLSSVTILNGVTSIGDSAFSGCTSLKSILIPNSVISIGTYAFKDCSLESLTIPESVTSIRTGIFMGCTSLASVTIPSSITSIPMEAFTDCTSLTAITIPSSVTTISSDAFKRCNNLTFMKVDNVTPCSFYSSSFTKRTNAVLSVPVGSKSSYEAADYWKDFKKIVENFEGDVNVDEEVDVLDVVDIARFVVGSPAESFVEILADINKDREVNLGDAVTLVNTIAGDQNFVKAWNAPSQTIANDVLYMSDSNGTLSLNLENEREYTAFQFDLFVPEGAEVSQMLLNAGRKQGHQLIYNKVEEGHYRVAALSTSNQTFNGNIGELLNITLNGISGEEVRLCNIHFFDAEGQNYLFEDLESTIATEIESLHPAFSQSEGAIYDIQGRRQERMLHGINIVGGKKVVVK